VINSIEKPIVSGYRFYPAKAGVFDLYDSYEIIEKNNTHKALTKNEKKKIVIELYKTGLTQREIIKELSSMGISITQRTIATYFKEWKEENGKKDILVTA
jgi:arsenate reductase-like glutaredoxin family protein